MGSARFRGEKGKAAVVSHDTAQLINTPSVEAEISRRRLRAYPLSSDKLDFPSHFRKHRSKRYFRNVKSYVDYFTSRCFTHAN